MLNQLWDLWRRYEGCRLEMEVSLWLSQHCVAADDFAFSLACAMQQAVRL